MGPVSFILLNLAAALVAARAGKFFAPRRDPWLKAMTSVFAFILVSIAITGILGITGILTRGAALAVSAVIAATSFLIKPPESPDPGETPPGMSLMEHIALAAAFALAAGVAAQAVLLPLSHLPDDLSYHGPAAASWLAAHRIFPAPETYQAYYPMNAELFSLWFMLPFHSDAMVGISGLCWAALLGLSAATFARRLGARHGAAALAGALAMGSLPVMAQAASFAGADLAGAAAALAALAFASQSQPEHRNRFVLASGLAAGLAVGCKPTFIPVAVIVLIWIAFAVWKDNRCVLKSSAVFIAAAFAAGGGFYLRNLILTGNPFFPAPLGPLPGSLDASILGRTRLISFILESPADFSMWKMLVLGFGYWPFIAGLCAVAGYIAALPGLARRDRKDAAPWLFASGIFMAVIFPLLPFSGSDYLSVPVLRTGPRFIILEASIGLVLLSSRTAQDGWRAKALPVLLLTAAVDAVRGQIFHPIVVICAVSAVPVFFAGRIIFMKRVKIPPLALAAAALAVLAAAAPFKESRNREALYSIGAPDKPVGRAWREIDKLPAGSRIAWAGPAAYRIYPLFGRRFTLVPVKFKAQDNGVDYFFVTKWDGDTWPPEQAALENSSSGESIYNDGYSAIWKIK